MLQKKCLTVIVENISNTFSAVMCPFGDCCFFKLSPNSTRLKYLFVSLQDQFDNLEKHTQWGIDVLEKYIKFVKERTEIEISYAKQLR